jgi:hypothetical protein
MTQDVHLNIRRSEWRGPSTTEKQARLSPVFTQNKDWLQCFRRANYALKINLDATPIATPRHMAQLLQVYNGGTVE